MVRAREKMRPDEEPMTEWEHEVIVDQVIRKGLLRRWRLIRDLHDKEEKFCEALVGAPSKQRTGKHKSSQAE